MSTKKIQASNLLLSQPFASYDSNALLIGRFVLETTGADDVILFGSRSRGDHRDDSDIDLLVLLPALDFGDPDNWETLNQYQRIAGSRATSLYGMPVCVQTVWYTTEEFQRFRRSRNHVAAIAAAEGINMEGGRASEQYPDEGNYSEEWSVTLDRCYHARTHLRGLTAFVQAGQADLLLGQQAQQALEHAIKGLISASGRQYRHLHDLVELEQDLRRADPEFSHRLSSPLELLSRYAGGDIYGRGREDNSLGDSNILLHQVQEDVQQIFHRVAELTGRDPWQDQA